MAVAWLLGEGSQTNLVTAKCNWVVFVKVGGLARGSPPGYPLYSSRHTQAQLLRGAAPILGRDLQLQLIEDKSESDACGFYNLRFQ